MWHCTSRQCQPACSTPHSSSPTTTSKIPPWLSTALDSNKRTWNEVDRRDRGRVNTPCKCAWIVSGTQPGVGGHPYASDLQPDPVHACQTLGSYWFSRRTHPLPLCVPLSRKIPSNRTLDEKSVKTMNLDLNQLQNEIWWTWFSAEFSEKFNSKAHQMCVFLLNSIVTLN